MNEFGFFLANDFKLVIKRPVLEWVDIPAGTFSQCLQGPMSGAVIIPLCLKGRFSKTGIRSSAFF